MSDTGINPSSQEESSDTQPKKPLVFISHDTRDAEAAECFSRLLSGASAGILKSFRSSDKKGNQGIQYGVEWYPEIMRKLNEASDVVCLLTKNSLERPWILFEAGVAKGKLNTTVYGIALGIPLSSANSGPFAQFQNCADDEDSITKLVAQLVSKIPGSEPDKDVIRIQAKDFLEKSKKSINNIAPEPPSISASDTSVAKLFEEIKIMYSELPDRICKSSYYERPRRPRRINPKFFESIVFNSPNPKIGLYMLLNSLKDDMPWIYESGIDLLKIKDRHSPAFLERLRELREVIEFTFNGSFGREMIDLGPDRPDYMFMLFRCIDYYTNAEIEDTQANYFKKQSR